LLGVEKSDPDGDFYLLLSTLPSLFLANLAIREFGLEDLPFKTSGSMYLTVYTPSTISSNYSSRCEVLRLISDRWLK